MTSPVVFDDGLLSSSYASSNYYHRQVSYPTVKGDVSDVSDESDNESDSDW